MYPHFGRFVTKQLGRHRLMVLGVDTRVPAPINEAGVTDDTSQHIAWPVTGTGQYEETTLQPRHIAGGEWATMTRIIAGRFGGRRIAVPDDGTRPTSDRVREAVFNMLDARIDLDGAAVADLYAGSGALGIEALSRGASSAVFVDSRRRATSVIVANLNACGVLSAARVVTGEVGTFLSADANPFDVIFMDPPYDLGTDIVQAEVAAAERFMADEGLLVLERSSRSSRVQWPAVLELVVDKTYGDTRVEIGRR